MRAGTTEALRRVAMPLSARIRVLRQCRDRRGSPREHGHRRILFEAFENRRGQWRAQAVLVLKMKKNGPCVEAEAPHHLRSARLLLPSNAPTAMAAYWPVIGQAVVKLGHGPDEALPTPENTL